MAVGGGDAGRLLAAMLQGVEAEIGFARGVGMAVDGDDAAFFVQFVACGDEREQGTGNRDRGEANAGPSTPSRCTAALRSG